MIKVRRRDILQLLMKDHHHTEVDENEERTVNIFNIMADK